LRIPFFNPLKNKKSVAIPDFFIPSENKIIEVKSYFTYNKEEMLARIEAYEKRGYMFMLYLEQKEYYKNNLPETNKKYLAYHKKYS
jgi:hypothetical protein